MYALLLAALAPCSALVLLEPHPQAGVYLHVTATFGPRLSGDGAVNGTVVESAPANACEALTNDVAGQIVVADRGSCDFIQKVRNARDANAIAVIVANDQGEHLFKMYSSDEDTSDIDIPSVFVTTSTGQLVRGANVVLNATGEYNFADDDFMHPYFFMAIILLGLSVTLACTLAATVVGYVVVSFKTRRQQGECKRAVARLKTRKHRASAEEGCDGSCTICLDDYEEGDLIKELPCGHSYHQECIDPWLLQKSSLCPLCKQNIIAGAEDLHAAPAPAPAPDSAQNDSAPLEAALLQDTEQDADIRRQTEELNRHNPPAVAQTLTEFGGGGIPTASSMRGSDSSSEAGSPFTGTTLQS